MQLAEVIIREVQRNRSFKIFQLFAESIGQSGQPAAMHPQGVILLFDMGSGNPANIGHPGNDCLLDFNHLRRAVSAGRLFRRRGARFWRGCRLWASGKNLRVGQPQQRRGQ